MHNDIIELGRGEITENAAADQNLEYTFREVFAEVRSVSQNEFYTAAQSGFKPVYRFILADYYDYEGEEIVRYQDELYNIVRTFRNGVELELTVERRIGDADDG